MKFLSILVAASLILSPVAASAGAAEKGTENSRPIAGPTAVKPLDDDELPAAALLAGGVVLFGAAIVALVGGNDPSNDNKTTSTNGTLRN